MQANLTPKPETSKSHSAPETVAGPGAPGGLPLFLRAVQRPVPPFSRTVIARTGLASGPSELLSPDGEHASPARIRVFDNQASHQAAFRLGAHAYAWGGDIFLGSGLGGPGAPSRADALRHERIHALQARNSGPWANERALEREAHDPSARWPQLSADPDSTLGLWFLVPVAIGVYILLRPNVANAPAPDTQTQPSVSEAQIVGEALALFAVPGGVASGLGRLGYGVIAAYGVSGAVSAASYRGVQDVGAGQFSGVEAYVVDATTGAVIGMVVGGVFRPSLRLGPARTNPPLVHLTDTAGEAGINASGVLRGSQGIYALPATAASEGTAMRVLRTLVRPSRTGQVIGVPGSAGPLFTRPVPMGPISAYQRMMGVFRAPAGQISRGTGAFTPSGNALANITGQFWPYGIDGFIWASGIAAGTLVSPAAEGAYDRGMFSPIHHLIGNRPPLPETSRSDGPFVFATPAAAPEGVDSTLDPETGTCRMPDSSSETLSSGDVSQSGPQCSASEGGAPPIPGVIFVTPLTPNPDVGTP